MKDSQDSFYKEQVKKHKKQLEAEGFDVRKDGTIKGKTHDFIIKSSQ